MVKKISKRGSFAAFASLPTIAFGLSLITLCGSASLHQRPAQAVPHAPEATETGSPLEKPMRTSSAEENSRLDKAIQPYVTKARAGLPAIKKRFNAGMPKDEVLMLTIRVYDPDKKYEQVFVTVQSWTDKEISGSIASELIGIKSHKMGDDISFKPEDILDWTIEKSDGTEEGNVVGNFLNTYK